MALKSVPHAALFVLAALWGAPAATAQVDACGEEDIVCQLMEACPDEDNFAVGCYAFILAHLPPQCEEGSIPIISNCILPSMIEFPAPGFGLRTNPDWCPLGYNPQALVNLCFFSGAEAPGNFHSETVYVVGNFSVQVFQLDEDSGFTVPIGVYIEIGCNTNLFDCGCVRLGPEGPGPSDDPLLKICAFFLGGE